MLDKEKLFREILDRYNVRNCFVCDYFDFNVDEPNGIIFVDEGDDSIIKDLYDIFTLADDGIVGDEQTLFIGNSDFSERIPNYKVDNVYIK